MARQHPMVAGFGLLIVATLAMRLVWGWQVGRELAAQQAAIRARGEPVLAADLVITPVPDGENAWLLINKAAAADTGISPASTNTIYPDHPPFGPRWEKDAEVSENAHAAVFQLARQARGKKHAQFRSNWATPLINTTFPSLNSSRQVANTLGDGALYRHVRGDDREALERLLDMRHLGRLLHKEEFAVGQLVSIGVTALTTARTQAIAPGLKLDEPEVRQLARTLIDSLLDERKEHRHFRNSLTLERVMVTDTHVTMSNGAWAIKPLADQESSLTNVLHSLYREAALQPDAESARDVLRRAPPFEIPPLSINWMPAPAPSKLAPDYSLWYAATRWRMDRYFEQWFRILGERRATAISLAVQLYRSDHEGKWPDKLDQLVPDYLPAVPPDPFHADGRQMGYVILKGGLPDGGDRPLVYFDAGPDAPGIIDVEPMIGWQNDPMNRRPRLEVIRQYRDLARWSPQVRRVDAMIAEQEEAERKEKEEMEQLQKELEQEEKGMSPDEEKPGSAENVE